MTNNQKSEQSVTEEYKGVQNYPIIVGGKRYTVYANEVFISIYNADNRCITGAITDEGDSDRLILSYMVPHYGGKRSLYGVNIKETPFNNSGTEAMAVFLINNHETLLQSSQ